MDHSGWTEFLATPDRAAHGVQVYERTEELVDSVAAYVAAGIALGEPALLVARAENQDLFADRLGALGWDAQVLASVGLLTMLDAESSLAALLDGDRVSPDRFASVIGAALDDIASTFPGRRVRAFGEMVDVLCERGDNAGAAQLEELWNDAAAERDFALLCGYRLDVFDRRAQLGTLPTVCMAHTHVKAASDSPRFDHAVQSALVQVLGPTHARMVYGMVAEGAGGAGTPLSQRALMWVSDQMPALSERILAQARAQYAA